MASQLVTHALIRDAGFTLPPDAEALDGVSVEEAYDRLPDPRQDDSGGDGDSPPAGGAMGAAAAGDGDEDSSDDRSDTPYGPGDDDGDDSGAAVNSGGRRQGRRASSGADRDQRRAATSDPRIGTIYHAPSLTPSRPVWKCITFLPVPRAQQRWLRPAPHPVLPRLPRGIRRNTLVRPISGPHLSQSEGTSPPPQAVP